MSRLLVHLRRPRLKDRHALLGVLAAVLVAVVTVGSALGAVAAARQADPAGPSPAQDGAQVVAQGVGEMPADQVAWRVTQATAAGTSAEPIQNALGFILADGDGLLLNNVDSGEQERLATGEATFTAAGSRHELVALDGEVSLYRLELTPADDVSADDLVVAGGSFSAPAGNRDIDLVRATLEEDGESELSLGSDEAPAFLFVTDGAVDVIESNAADATGVAAGEAFYIGGDVTVRATDPDGATFVVAVIGAEVPAYEPPAPPTSADTGTITVEALGCPVAYEGTSNADDCTEPLADIEFQVGYPNTDYSEAGTTDADGTVTFSELAANTYFLIGGVPAEFATQIVECANADGPIPTEPTQSEIPGGVFDLAAGDETTCSWYVIPEDLQGGDPGTIAIAVKLCPTADTPLDSCDFSDITAPLTMTGPVTLSTGPESDVPVRIHGPNYVWGEEGGIPYGTYYLPVDMPAPEGYTLDRVAGSLGGSEIGYAIAVDADTPNAYIYLVYVPAGDSGKDLGNDGIDKNCADFGELNAAQLYFEGDGGSVERNVDNLDANRNGAACEAGDDGDVTEPGEADLGNDGVDMNCGDFGELNAAQLYFTGDGGSADRNVDNMDADRDGAACEAGDDGDVTEPGEASA
jgi:quercetin dioxygenase-like cupin family protein